MNTLDNTITVLLGQGDGPPTAKGTPTPTISGPTSIVTGDFNGDGIADLAIASYAQATVQIFLGNGDGTFTSFFSHATGNGVSGLVVGDFNADGFPDLATVNALDNSVYVLVGQGNGSFSPATLVSVGAGPGGIAAGDLNDDGIPDQVVPNSGSNTVSVLLTQLTQSATATATGVLVGPGTETVDAQYTGSLDFLPSTSSTISLAGSLVTTQLSVSASASATTSGQQVTLTATLSPSAAQGQTTDGEGVADRQQRRTRLNQLALLIRATPLVNLIGI